MFSNIHNYLHSFFQSKYRVDLLFNTISFGIAGISFIIINLIIVRAFKTEGLGYFNQVYAFYVLISQFAAWGIHLSVQKYIPQFSTNRKNTSELIVSALVLTLLFSISISSLVLLFHKVPGYIVDSNMVRKGFIYVVPGLFFFALNKVLLSFYNGMRFMKTYALLNALRYIGMMVTLIIIISFNFNLIYIVLLFTIPEIIVFIIALLFVLPHIDFLFTRKTKRLMRLHFAFGNKAAIGNIVLGTRPDVIICGYYLSDTLVGIYTFASTIIDGFLQLFYVFRTNLNPLITQTYYGSGSKPLEQFISKNIKVHYKLFISAGLASLLLFPVFIAVVGITEQIELYIVVYTLLLFGCISASGYIPFQMLFNQIGKPKVQTWFLLQIFIFMCVTNAIAVYFFGIVGAAAATSVAFIFQVYLIKKLTYKHLGISI